VLNFLAGKMAHFTARIIHLLLIFIVLLAIVNFDNHKLFFDLILFTLKSTSTASGQRGKKQIVRGKILHYLKSLTCVLNQMGLITVNNWRPKSPKMYVIKCCGESKSCINRRPQKKPTNQPNNKVG
jgi:ABC-type iron transport system FetAB permease component